MPEQTENGTKSDGKEKFIVIPKNVHTPLGPMRFVTKSSKNALLSSFSSVVTMPFPNCAG